MKIRVTLKDPDRMADDVDRAFDTVPKPDGVNEQEWDAIREDRAAVVKGAIASEWMRYGEYLTVEFDIEAHTATVIPNKDSQ